MSTLLKYSYQGAINLDRSHQPSTAFRGGLHHLFCILITTTFDSDKNPLFLELNIRKMVLFVNEIIGNPIMC